MKANLDRHRELLAAQAGVDELVENDLAFHRILSDNCGNIVMKTVYDYVMEAFRSILVRTTSIQIGSEDSLTLRDHLGILNSIEERDFAKAKHAVQNSAKTWFDLM